MTKHTLGPWTLETVPTVAGVCHMIGKFPPREPEGKPRHACLYADYESVSNPADQELYANARLIAAAPELLEALQFLLEQYNPLFDNSNHKQVEAYYTARSALSKATGE